MDSLKQKINRITVMAAIAAISLPACFSSLFVKASEGYSENVIRNAGYNGRNYYYGIEKTYETTDSDKEAGFEESYNGKRLVDVSYETIASAPETEIKEERLTKTYKDLESKSETAIPQSVTVGEVECRLDNVSFIKQDTDEHVSYRLQLGYSDSEPNYPMTYDYTYTSPVTDKEVTVTLPFSHIEKGEEGWIDGFSAKVTLQNIDGEYFDFGGSTYTYSESGNPSFSEEEYAYLVRQLGLNTGKYRLTSAAWSGEPYKKGGVTCRDAVCSGQQYGAMYEAVYEDDVVNQELYTATATYTGSKEIETGNMVYTIKATAYYGEKRVNIVTVSIAILLFIFLVVAILCYISLGKKKNVSDSDHNSSL